MGLRERYVAVFANVKQMAAVTCAVARSAYTFFAPLECAGGVAGVAGGRRYMRAGQ